MDDHGQTHMDRQHVFAINGTSRFLDVLRELLQGERYNVTMTNFLPATFDHIAALHPNLLIIDPAIGSRDGWDLLERLANEAKTNQIPVIVIATNAQLENHVQTGPQRLGDHHFLREPFDHDALLRMIGELIGPA